MLPSKIPGSQPTREVVVDDVPAQLVGIFRDIHQLEASHEFAFTAYEVSFLYRMKIFDVDAHDMDQKYMMKLDSSMASPLNQKEHLEAYRDRLEAENNELQQRTSCIDRKGARGS